LKNVLSSKTKVLILNSPSNPTGQIYSIEELKALASVLERTGVWVISDDIYDRMIFTGQKVAPNIAQTNENLRNQVILVNSLSKTYSMTGWRIGSAMGDKKVIDACTNMQSQSSSCGVSFAQAGGVEALRGDQSQVDKAMVNLARRKTLVYNELKSIVGLDIIEPQGAFYAWPCVEKFFGESITNSQEFAAALLEKEGVAVVPGVEFGMEGYFRLSYTLDEKRLKDGLTRIKRFIDSLE
jgi:aspartate aminotransferase